ncbi:uncharacterized protein [Antedon mediterranea]
MLKRKRENEEKKKEKRMWIKPWLARRNELGACETLMRELRTEDRKGFENYIRMDHILFDHLLKLVGPTISRKDTVFREAIPAHHRLSVTLRFLATGESYTSLAYQHRISKQSISKLIPEVCEAIYDSLKDEYMKTPSTQDEWRKVSNDYFQKWQFPNCIGSIDGKHITMQCPPKSGSFYYNYKGTHSIVLMALVDANYRFLYIDVGCNGRISDGGVLRNSTLWQALTSESNMLNIPEPCKLPGSDIVTPHVILADDAFPLHRNIMKPYPQRGLSREKRAYNYRLSRGRRVVENVFGHLANRFRIFHSKIMLVPSNCQKVVLCTCVLHNYLRANGEEMSAEAVSKLQNLDSQGSNNSTSIAKDIREQFCHYVNEVQPLPWQYN